MQLHVKTIKFQIYEERKRRIFTFAESQSKIFFFFYDKNCKWWFDFLDRKKYARHLTLDLIWSLRVPSFKQIIPGHILHLKTDLRFNIQAGISAGNDSFSAAILDCVSSVSEPRWPDSWLSVRISLSFPVSASSLLMGRPAMQQLCQTSRKNKSFHNHEKQAFWWIVMIYNIL